MFGECQWKSHNQSRTRTHQTSKTYPFKTQIRIQTTAPSDPPPPQPQPAVPTAPPPPVPPESKKRSLDNYGPIQECSYFKMRAVVKDIRPHFLEMLRTVDFRSCKGAEELQEIIQTTLRW
ncbi:T1N6.14 PROTEIN [Salix koriyanagi]|uniref:T1N6.14 PROTEIN n=1 Tax=Salix koriyanagi TaxID=2511006 RepID=A0A9Q0YTY5_9ROSI|nr:T1N6.14 PROTEIN [Salix koriyanagi]